MARLKVEDGTRIFYQVRGKGRPAYLFVHGWCSHLGHWKAQVRHFSRHSRVLAVDRRGHGRSDVPESGYSAEQHAADLAQVARHEEIRSAVVVGHAGAAPSVLELARSHPELVRALVLVDARVAPGARIGDPDDPSGMALGALIERLEGPDGADELRKMYAGFFSAHARRIGRKAVADALETPLRVAAAELRCLAVDSEAIARELTQPVLWLSVAGADQAMLGAIFRDVQFGQVVGSGHFPQLEVPKQTNAMIARFVATLRKAEPDSDAPAGVSPREESRFATGR